jgi:cytochrome c-type biogenesis protein CcmF
MHAEYGHYLLFLAFFISIALGVIPMLGTFIKQPFLIATARPLTILLFCSLCFALVLLAYSFLIDDFSVAYVASHSNSLLPDRFKFSAVWGGHEGSLLLWVFILSAWMLAVSILGKHLPPLNYARILSVLGWIACGFIAFLLFTSNPFERTLPFIPIDGTDLTPLLQDFGLIIHPPLLYMGYVGFAVSFAFAISALIEGQWDAKWARWTRPWTMTAWSCLTLGVMLGSWWAYYELGWGGWWMWDPSENASLLPWLSGTALIHSLAVTDKRNTFKKWTLALSLLTFSLSLLGTFLIRSGVITSVHAFANDPSRGRFILIFLALIIGIALLLFSFRAHKIETKVNFSILSKEMFLLFNNILLMTLTFIVLFGTLYPIFAEAFGRKLSVGAPYFNRLFPYPVILLSLLMGIAPLLHWKNNHFNRLKKPLFKTFIMAFLLSGVSVFFTETFYFWVFLGVFLAVWIGILSIYHWLAFITYIKTGFKRFRKMTPTFLGMSLAHLGVAVMLIGIVFTSYFSIEKDLRISMGETVQVGKYQFKMKSLHDTSKDNYQATQIIFQVWSLKEPLFEMKPEKRYYLASHQLMTEAAIEPHLLRDLYIALGEPLNANKTTWSVRIYNKPFIRWIWLGALMMGLGGLISVMDKRYRKKHSSQRMENTICQ